MEGGRDRRTEGWKKWAMEEGRERGRSREIREATKSVKRDRERPRTLFQALQFTETFHDLQARAALQSRNDGRCAYNSHHGSGRTD